ncbi:MAG: ABC transporter permease subunit [Clostridia bacterium]|nr:ABC transporter permease subunit [Clostridia bacterium]
MKRFLNQYKLNIICSFAAIALIIVCWIIAYYAVGNDYVVPSFQDTLKSFFVCFGEGAFWVAFLFTLLRTAIAFLISFVLAALCAVAAAFSKVFKLFIQPFITVMRTLPTLAVILLLLVWTNAKAAPVIVTVLLLFPMIYVQIYAAISGVDKDVLQMADFYNVNKKDKLFKIYLPQISPAVFAQVGANVSLGLKVMISAEVLSNTYKSLGGLMQSARSFLEMPRLAALTLMAVILGLIFEIAFAQLKRINSKWQKGGCYEDRKPL